MIAANKRKKAFDPYRGGFIVPVILRASPQPRNAAYPSPTQPKKFLDSNRYLVNFSFPQHIKPMKLPTTFAIATLAIVTAATSASAQNATTDPVGFVTCNITAGTGAAKKVTLFSAPLLESPILTGQMTGQITSFTSNSISNSNAGWIGGDLSTASAPTLIQITSGNATGRMFLVATTPVNTATTLTISSTDSAQVDLATAGLSVGDSYKILACDTLATLFGTPASSGILGGGNSTVADSIILVFNGSAATYFYSTTNSRWSRVAPGSPDATNTAVPPYYGIQYQRLAATPLSFTFTGNVPTQQRQLSIKNSGATLLSQFYPSDVTLLGLGLQNLSGWVSNASSSAADTVVLSSAGSASTYWFNGTNWKRVGPGSPTSDTTVIAPGTSISIFKRGSTSGYASFIQSLPYSL